MSDQPHSRRAFFRQVVKRYVEPAVDYLDSRGASSGPVILRPPGAIAEGDFLDQCERCHACVDACPADAIRPIETEGPMNGTPGVVAAEQPCVVCTDLDCMPACPSGALQVLPRYDIEMGVAVVDHETCVRSRGESCQACIDLCPLGTRAIDLDAEGRVDILSGCIGCGVCEQACPTTPKAITVTPNPSRGAKEVVHRVGVRALLMAPDQRVLLMKLKEPGYGVVFWITPGGGIEPGESETVALLRELSEEVGQNDYVVGQPLWKRSSRFTWMGQAYTQDDTTYLIQTSRFDPGDGEGMGGSEQDAFQEFRWWSAEEILASDEVFSPRRLGRLVQRIRDDGPPDEPITTGT